MTTTVEPEGGGKDGRDALARRAEADNRELPSTRGSCDEDDARGVIDTSRGREGAVKAPAQDREGPATGVSDETRRAEASAFCLLAGGDADDNTVGAMISRSTDEKGRGGEGGRDVTIGEKGRSSSSESSSGDPNPVMAPENPAK